MIGFKTTDAIISRLSPINGCEVTVDTTSNMKITITISKFTRGNFRDGRFSDSHVHDQYSALVT